MAPSDEFGVEVGRKEYECRICDNSEEQVATWERELEICTDCWFDFLTGAERKAIAERTADALEERRVVW